MASPSAVLNAHSDRYVQARRSPTSSQDTGALLADCENRLAELPPPITGEPVSAVLGLVSSFVAEFKTCVEGRSLATTLVQDTRRAYETFRDEVRGTAPRFSPFEDRGYDATYGEELDRLEPGERIPQISAALRETITLADVRERIARAVTHELPNNVPYRVKTSLIGDFQKRWNTRIHACAAAVLRIVQDVMSQLIKATFGSYLHLEMKLTHIVHELIQLKLNETTAFLARLLHFETSRAPFTQNEHFLQDSKEKYLALYASVRARALKPPTAVGPTQAAPPAAMQNVVAPWALKPPAAPGPSQATSPALVQNVVSPQKRSQTAAHPSAPATTTQTSRQASAPSGTNGTTTQRVPTAHDWATLLGGPVRHDGVVALEAEMARNPGIMLGQIFRKVARDLAMEAKHPEMAMAVAQYEPAALSGLVAQAGAVLQNEAQEGTTEQGAMQGEPAAAQDVAARQSGTVTQAAGTAVQDTNVAQNTATVPVREAAQNETPTQNGTTVQNEPTTQNGALSESGTLAPTPTTSPNTLDSARGGLTPSPASFHYYDGPGTREYTTHFFCWTVLDEYRAYSHFTSITALPSYQRWSFEELRAMDYSKYPLTKGRPATLQSTETFGRPGAQTNWWSTPMALLGDQHTAVSTEQPKTAQLDVLLAQMALLGYILTREDLENMKAKVPAEDNLKTELEVMAEVRAYFKVSYKRIVDIVPLAIDHEFMYALADTLQGWLIQKLCLGSKDAEEKCTAYLAEDPHTAAMRKELIARKSRLLEELQDFSV